MRDQKQTGHVTWPRPLLEKFYRVISGLSLKHSRKIWSPQL